MGITDIACYITYGQAAEDIKNYEDLERAFEQSFEDLAYDFFSNVSGNIIEALRQAAENPLCNVLVSCLLVVLAFHIVPVFVGIFKGRG